MVLTKPLFFVLLVAGIPLFATAADRTSQQPARLDLQTGNAASGESTASSQDGFISAPEGNFAPTASAFSLALASQGNVCYTMRSYKVKPKERFAEHESARAGYAKCEMASSYRIRSADGVSPARPKIIGHQRW